MEPRGIKHETGIEFLIDFWIDFGSIFKRRLAHAVQLTVPIGDDGHLMSCGFGGWPVLWLNS